MQWPRLAGERQQHVRFNIHEVIGALFHARVIERLESRDRSSGRLPPRISGAFALADEACRAFIQRRILQKLEMRGDDFMARRTAGVAHAFEP